MPSTAERLDHLFAATCSLCETPMPRMNADGTIKNHDEWRICPKCGHDACGPEEKHIARSKAGKLIELPELRDNYGNDSRAINRHSERFYHVHDVGFFMLDRNLSCCPPCFELLELRGDPRLPVEQPYIPRTIEMDDGAGLTWKAAESLAIAAIVESKHQPAN